jgi:hypothetical protein
MKAYSKVSSKTHTKVSGKTREVGGGILLPPVRDKLISWLKGQNLSETQKREFINSYHFTIQNCPPDYWLDGAGDPLLDGAGDPIWSSLEYTGWGCEYLAPASGEDGYAELLAIDDGTLYSGGVPIALDQAALEAIDNDQMFFCILRGFYIYDQVLTGDDLYAALLWCSKIEAVTEGGEIVTESGETYFERI